MNRQLLEGKVCIITGASRGIGAATAELFAEEGGALVLVGRSKQGLEALEARLRKKDTQVTICVGDVSDPRTAEKVVALTIQTYRKLDVLVNNAGTTNRESFMEMKLESWDAILRTNLYGTLFFCKESLKHMKAGGTIVNVSSLAAVQPNLNHNHAYGVSKAGILALTRSLALQFAPLGIRINAICPGPFDTDMTSDWSPEYRSRKIEGIPLHKIGKPLEAAQCILFLASELSSFVCGAVLHVNGGIYMP